MLSHKKFIVLMKLLCMCEKWIEPIELKFYSTIEIRNWRSWLGEFSKFVIFTLRKLEGQPKHLEGEADYIWGSTIGQPSSSVSVVRSGSLSFLWLKAPCQKEKTRENSENYCEQQTHYAASATILTYVLLLACVRNVRVSNLDTLSWHFNT